MDVGPYPPDPSVELPAPALTPPIAGPARRAQYVIELVGPRTVPAVQAAVLLSPQWYAALGQPEVYAMRPADPTWQRMTPSRDGAYDSLALAWDLITNQGAMTGTAAGHLLATVDPLATSLQRRAIPAPSPNEIDRVVRGLQDIAEGLDVGVSLMVIPHGNGISEESIWRECGRMGLTFSPTGAFEWRSPAHPEPLFAVTPIGVVDRFSLGNVHAGVRHDGVTIGFSVPRCPDPAIALMGAFKCAEVLAAGFDGVAFDEGRRPLTKWIQNELRSNLLIATSALDRAGLRPGSSGALKVFPATD